MLADRRGQGLDQPLASPTPCMLNIPNSSRYGSAFESRVVRLVYPFSFQDTTPDEMLSAVMTAVLTQVGLPAELLGDICVGENRSGPETTRTKFRLKKERNSEMLEIQENL